MFVRRLALACAMVVGLTDAGLADVLVTGSGLSTDYSGSGSTLWGLVGGATTGSAKNDILRYYAVATGTDGSRSVFSLGEIDPAFSGSASAPYVTFTGTGYALVDPKAGAAGRNVSNLASIQVLSAAPSTGTGGGPSNAVVLSGLSGHVGTYDIAALTSLPLATATVSGTTYTGTSLWGFIDPSSTSNITSQFVVTRGTDGYTVVLSLAELDPALGGNPADLLAYGGIGTTSGVARTIFPDDAAFKHGRWMSNLDSIEVAAVPELSTWAMMVLGFAGLGFVSYCRSRSYQTIAA